MNTGISSTPMRNALVLTSVMNSEAATMKVLGMVFGEARARPRNSDEDVVERRPRHLEVVYVGGGCQAAEERLRRAFQADFLELPVVRHRFDLGKSREGHGSACHPQPDRICAVLLL